MPLRSKGAGRHARDRPQEAATLDERDLAQRVTRGDRPAFEAVFRRHHQELYRYCRAILGDTDEAEDALQSTMVKALRALPGERREIALKPWLFRVAHNEAIGLVRARRSNVALDPEQVDLRGGIDEQAETRERLRRLVGDLEQLPERQRGAVIMRELNGMAFAEIGAAFGISDAAAKQTVYEARTSLHRMAEGRDMACDPIREAISADDRRRLRSRRIRAHLRQCGACRDFESSIAQRQADLAVLVPPIALPAALAALHGALGGAGGAAVGGAAAGGGAVGATAAAKSIAAVLAAITIAGGAAELGGLVRFGGSGTERGAAAGPAVRDADDASTTADVRTAPRSSTASAGLARAAGGGYGDGPARAKRVRADHRPSDRGPRSDSAHRHAHPATPAADAPGQTRTPPGQVRTPPGQSSDVSGSPSTPPGQASTPPGQASTPPGQASTPPGQAEGQSSAAPAEPPPGQSQTPPGQSQTPPGQASIAPGQTDEAAATLDTATPHGRAIGHSK